MDKENKNIKEFLNNLSCKFVSENEKELKYIYKFKDGKTKIFTIDKEGLSNEEILYSIKALMKSVEKLPH